MIRYGPMTRTALDALADACDAGWRAKAATRTANLITAGGFVETASIWANIKPVFMTLQSFKCAYCERPLGGRLAGSGEHDVEHFRPKSAIKAWPYPGRKPRLSYTFSTGVKSATGYHWLAYDLQNYAAACRPCNSSRKSDYFPIAGPRGVATQDIATLNASEKPFLLFPLGEYGDDPADYIEFDGILAVPKHATGVKNLRARVTIDFFSLNDREELWVDRIRVIQLIFYAWRTALTDPIPAIRARADASIQEAMSDSAPQAACARSFYRVTQADPVKAWEMFEAAESFFQSK